MSGGLISVLYHGIYSTCNRHNMITRLYSVVLDTCQVKSYMIRFFDAVFVAISTELPGTQSEVCGASTSSRRRFACFPLKRQIPRELGALQVVD